MNALRSLLIAFAVIVGSSDAVRGATRCLGLTPCPACLTCSGCAHCMIGGTCGAKKVVTPAVPTKPRPPSLPASSYAPPQKPATPAPGPHTPAAVATLSVRLVSIGKQITTNWQSDWGSYQKEYVRSGDLEIRVSTVGRIPVQGFVQYYFVGKPVDGNDRSIIASGKKAVSISAPGSGAVIGSSGNITATDNRYRALGTRDTTGKRIEGWVVILKDKQGRELDAKASSTYLLDWYKKDGAGRRSLLAP